MINEVPLSSPIYYRKTKKRKPQQLLEVPSVRLLNSLALGKKRMIHNLLSFNNDKNRNIFSLQQI